MKLSNVSIVLALTGLVAAGVITGLGTTQQVSARQGSEGPNLGELYVTNVPLSDSALDFVRRTTGKLYVTFSDDSTKSGTATVVFSENRDMLITSGRLLINENQPGERAAQVRFVPGQRLELPETSIHEPYGSWMARNWAILPNHDHNSPGTQDNLAVVLLNTRDDEHILDAVGGGQGLCFFQCPRRGQFHVYAYHQGYDRGETLDTTCQVNGDISDPERPYGTCIEGRPALGGQEASGAPVIADLDPNTGAGMIIAVHTWLATFHDGKQSNGGTYLGSKASALYAGYRNA